MKSCPFSLQLFPIYKQIKLQFILRKLSFGSRPSEVILRKPSFESHPSEAILRDIHPPRSVRLGSSFSASIIRLLRYASDHPLAPQSSVSFGTPRIILWRLTYWPMKTYHVGELQFSPPISPFFRFSRIENSKKYFWMTSCSDKSGWTFHILAPIVQPLFIFPLP